MGSLEEWRLSNLGILQANRPEPAPKSLDCFFTKTCRSAKRPQSAHKINNPNSSKADDARLWPFLPKADGGLVGEGLGGSTVQKSQTTAGSQGRHDRSDLLRGHGYRLVRHGVVAAIPTNRHLGESDAECSWFKFFWGVRRAPGNGVATVGGSRPAARELR